MAVRVGNGRPQLHEGTQQVALFFERQMLARPQEPVVKSEFQRFLRNSRFRCLTAAEAEGKVTPGWLFAHSMILFSWAGVMRTTSRSDASIGVSAATGLESLMITTSSPWRAKSISSPNLRLASEMDCVIIKLFYRTFIISRF